MSKTWVVCPHCSAGLNVNNELLGKLAKCPKCQASFELKEEDFSAYLDDPDEQPREQLEHVKLSLRTASSSRRVPVPKPPQRLALNVSATFLCLFGWMTGLIGLLGVFVFSYQFLTDGVSALSWIVISLGVTAYGLMAMAFGELIRVFLSQEELQRALLIEVKELNRSNT